MTNEEFRTDIFTVTQNHGVIVRITLQNAIMRDRNAEFEDVFSRTVESDNVLCRAVSEIGEYLRGKRRKFSVPYALHGSDFQMRVWHEIENIPYGQTCTYGEIAGILGKPGAARAVGNACGANPIPLLVPCHRVIAERNEIGGYRYGTELKKFLLNLEQKTVLRSI